ncbi:MAG TPA: sugar phosphate nucleotidyltransferase [Anaerolineae bacterium]|nr:sugar phosphate nucleotidyltransferase [Anaerolineae bacterium]
MKVIIPLGGLGTRLRPHTYTRPKPLINVAGKPMLGHIIDKFAHLPVEEYIFVVGYLGEQIEQYVQNTYPFRARFVEQKEPLGQAHALWLCREYVDGPAFMIFGDTLFDADLNEVAYAPVDNLVYAKEVDDPRRFGVVVLCEDGSVDRFVEKPESMNNRLAVIGMYYYADGPLLMRACEELMERQLQTKGEFFLADANNLMIEQGARFVPRTVEVWLDTGKPETVLETNRYLLSNGSDNSSSVQFPACVIVPPVNVHPTAKIEEAVIGPYATIGESCHIHRAIIRDSIIEAGATITDTFLDQSLIGREATVTGRYRKFNVGDSANVGFS